MRFWQRWRRKKRPRQQEVQRGLREIQKALPEPEEEPVQLSLFDTMGILPVEVKESPVEQELKALDLGNMTPIQALNLLYELQQKCR